MKTEDPRENIKAVVWLGLAAYVIITGILILGEFLI